MIICLPAISCNEDLAPRTVCLRLGSFLEQSYPAHVAYRFLLSKIVRELFFPFSSPSSNKYPTIYARIISLSIVFSIRRIRNCNSSALNLHNAIGNPCSEHNLPFSFYFLSHIFPHFVLSVSDARIVRSLQRFRTRNVVSDGGPEYRAIVESRK